MNLQGRACPKWRECPEALGSQEDRAHQLPSPGPVGARAPESEAEHSVRLAGPRPVPNKLVMVEISLPPAAARLPSFHGLIVARSASLQSKPHET